MKYAMLLLACSRQVLFEALLLQSEERNAQKVLIGKPQGKRPLGGPRHSYEDEIKNKLTNMCLEDVEWIVLFQGMLRGEAFVNTVMNLRVP
jgi:hypothetical protein